MIKLNFKKYIILAFIIVALVLLHYSRLSAPLENGLAVGTKPLLQGFYAAGSFISRTFSSQTAKEDLAQELELAQARVNQLTAENANLKFLEQENLQLRKQLNFSRQNKQRFIMADIISRGQLTEGAGGGQSIVIDKGTADGLSAGLAVVSPAVSATSTQAVVIGKVANVKDHLAEILLVTDKNCKLAVSILGENITSGVASGQLGLTVKMDFIPQTENIKTGAIAATSGLEQNIPRGLVIGRVSQVFKENNEVWQSAEIEPLINLDNLSIVSILLP